MITVKTTDKELLKAIAEVSADMPGAADAVGEYEFIHEGDGIEITGDGVVKYCDRRAALRAYSLLVQNGGSAVKETPKYDILGAMPDASRNAVPKIDTLKRFARILALEGYNALMLYTEDTYEIKGRPYFGHLRGRYTAKELKELESYCELLGIELIPAIQTLAHLNGMFEWPAHYELNDCNDIMLVGDEKVYQMIDDMLSTMASTLKTRKINIGLDEAKMLGSGRYLDYNEFKKRFLIMSDHMHRVVELCKKHGFEARMWSDMFFRMLNRGVYRVKGTVVPDEVVNSVPKELTLVYWDYIQPDVEKYDMMFSQHEVFHNNIAFAGGSACWYGLVPINVLGKCAALNATESIKRNNIKEVYVTMWGDDGASCSLFTSLVSHFIYGEACWSDHENREQNAAARLKACAGISEEVLLDLDRIHDLPGCENFGRRVLNPSKYMLYNNILTGKFDAHVPDGTCEHMLAMSEKLTAERADAGEFAYAIDSVIALCNALALKAELGKWITDAYRNGDRETLADIAENTIDAALSEMETLRVTMRDQWFKENKTFGFDVIDMRIGGAMAQITTARDMLLSWLSGDVDKIEELEADRLAYKTDTDGAVIELNRWERMAGQNISNMVGFM